ncbi:MAG: ribonuclease HII [Candidatus Gracilibacteria bacterium]|nr:ribonuclease HII [Candidatus Gracilibacteria bacterium]
MVNKIMVGIDEAGRGSWAGPVVAAVFGFDPKFNDNLDVIRKLKDSKKLSAKKRKEISEELKNLKKEKKVYFGIGEASSKIIDKINIRNANKMAMERAISNFFLSMSEENISKILVDGNDNYKFKNTSLKTEYIIRGDDLVDEIKAASIIAKVYRDELMVELGKKYKKHFFGIHKGYGTKKHQLALDEFGVTPIHRKSYKPIKNRLISGGFSI